MSRHYTLGIYDYNRKKICDLYDSGIDLIGQAYDISVTTDIQGFHTLTFSIPYVVDPDAEYRRTDGSRYGYAVYGSGRFGLSGSSGKSNRNFRWDFLRSDYIIRYTKDSETIWFVASKPSRSKSGKKIYGTVTCNGTESILKTRNIYKTFDDENGIGTAPYLMEQILLGTGWHFNSAQSDTLYETDTHVEKVRSLSSDGKQGALQLITTVCNMFQCRPIFDTDQQTVTIKALKNRQQVLEGEVGKTLSALTVNHDASNICTRVYIEGEYGDNGYVGIDDVEVDGEPYGLSFIMNFDYYRDLGVFTEEHEQALQTYLTQIRAKKQEIRANALLLIGVQDQLNNLIGQCKMALYYYDTDVTPHTGSLVVPMYVYGDITDEQAQLNENDDVVILMKDGTHKYEKWANSPGTQMIGAYGVAKFATPSAGRIGADEVAIEAKKKSIDKLEAKINVTVKADKIAEYRAEITRLNEEIALVYSGDDENDGLYDLMYSVMKSDGLLYQLSHYESIALQLDEDQDEIEATFIVAMGYLLRDGYWSNQNYVVGQEEYLYRDGLDMTKEMSHPTTDYTFSYVRVTEEYGVPAEDIEINAIFKLYDPELCIDDKMFVKKITVGVDNKSLGSIEVSNQDITLTGGDLGSLLSRMSQLADLIEQKNALYERAKSLTSEGNMYTDRLEGAIDVLRTKIMSTVSNWYTDEQGNLVFISADGTSSMMLSGAGFMIANSKNDDGSFNYRSFGDGNGFTADEIIAGFISADRIESRSITVQHLASDVGSSLDLSSNVALNAYINNTVDSKVAEMSLTDEQFTVMFNRTVKDDIDDSIEGVQENLNDYQTEVANYMRYDNSGALTLGRTDSAFQAQLTNTKMSFLESNAEVAYLSNQSMYITTARITETLSLGTNNGYGYFDWTVTPTGLGLKWRNPVILTITKTWQGALTSTAIRNTLAIKIEGPDVGGQGVNELNITYANFTNGQYTIANLPEGAEYTVTETNADTIDAGYVLDEENSTTSGTIVIPHSGDAIIDLINKYTTA